MFIYYFCSFFLAWQFSANYLLQSCQVKEQNREVYNGYIIEYAPEFGQITPSESMNFFFIDIFL